MLAAKQVKPTLLFLFLAEVFLRKLKNYQIIKLLNFITIQVGDSGLVIGVDMTPEMLKKARESAAKEGLEKRISYRLGEIEHIPVADSTVDVVISNCVINLSPDKPQVGVDVG